MVKKEWGKKHFCTKCETKFYDMNKEVLTCPNCGADYKPEKKSGRRGPASSRPKIEPKTAPEQTTEEKLIEVELDEDLIDEEEGEQWFDYGLDQTQDIYEQYLPENQIIVFAKIK